MRIGIIHMTREWFLYQPACPGKLADGSNANGNKKQLHAKGGLTDAGLTVWQESPNVGVIASLLPALNDVKNGMAVVFILLLITTTPPTYAQADIDAMEYYVDNDPGFGIATPISITTGGLVDIPLEMIDASTLPTGFHTLGVRARNTLGVWGFAERRQFYIPAPVTITNPIPADINAMEYYIDIDPGYGSGTAIIVTTGSLVDLPNQIIAASTLQTGFHTLGIRTQNTDGVWGFAEKRQFYIPAAVTLVNPVPADMQTLEYFFDVDPGFGLATSITITTGQLIDINELIPQSLAVGHHYIHIRAKNIDGTWGLSESRPVYIPATATGSGTAADITKIEYYFDGADPGIGNGIDLPITPGQLIDLNPVLVPTSPTLIDGPHYITFRAMNADNVWGMAEESTFDVLDDCMQPVAGFNPVVACAGEAIIFEDLSTNIQPDALYEWFFDGDDLADDFTTGTTSFTFTNPGTYDIGLAISQGTICYDSIGYTIDVIAKPVVLYSVTGLLIDTPTNFSVASSNVDPTATWEWDFDNDAVVDDNTVGSTSFTYTTATTYTAVIRVTDGLGCETSYQQTFVVGDGTGGGGGTPTANFLANDVCLGEVTQFVDISSNISPTAVYSWDFENDGIFDDNTFGSTSSIYPLAGDYNVRLKIDLGGGVIKEIVKLISVKPIPVTLFTVTDVCDGAITNFINGTTGTLAGSTFSWDFDGNGSIDSNSAGDETYVYSQPGQYTALLLVDNGSGCFSSYTQLVNVVALPVPDFVSAGSCTGTTVAFQDQSSGWTQQAQFDWDFDGDGTVDYTGREGASYVYGAPGDYVAKLSIDNGTGCKTEVTKTVSITQLPTADFDVTIGCAGDPIAFTDLSTTLPFSTYSWDFTTDGTEDDTSAGNTSFTFENPGTYTATLTIDNGSGCTSVQPRTFEVIAVPVPAFTVSGGCSGSEFIFFDASEDVGGTALYSWDFDGDGTADYDQSGDAFFTYSSPGTYDATLTIDNGSGCLVAKTETLTIAEVPEPDFEILSTCIGQPSQFVDLSAKVSPQASYSWDFNGDGVEDDTTVGSATYTFDVYKPYVATLTINNGLGCISSVDIIVDFTGAAAPDFKVGTTCLNEEVVFTDLSAELAIGAVYSWDFNGDGLKDSAHPGTSTYTFKEPGTYNAALTIFNADLCSATRTIPIVITALPVVDLGEDVQLCSESTVTLDAGAGYASYFWKGGSTEQTLTVDTFGEYWVSITDVKGCTNIDTIEVRLKDLPVAQFEYKVTYSPFDGIVVNFENTSADADTWSWDFGDGGTGDEMSPAHAYSDFSFYKETPYTICMTASDVCGITDQFCVDILLSPLALLENDNDMITVFPNPGPGVFNVHFPDYLSTPRQLAVLDAGGKIVKQISTVPSRGLQVNLENRAKGVYYFMIDFEQTQVLKRVILK